MNEETRTYLVKLVDRDRINAKHAYMAIRGEMLVVERLVDEAERLLKPRHEVLRLRRDLVAVTTSAEFARARMRRAEAALALLRGSSAP